MAVFGGGRCVGYMSKFLSGERLLRGHGDEAADAEGVGEGESS